MKKLPTSHADRRVRALLAAALLALALILGACGGSDDSGSSGNGGGGGGRAVHIALLAAATGNTFVDAAIAGAQDEARKLGADVTVFDAKFDPQKQFAQCQDAITQRKYDAIVVVVFAGPPMIPCAQAAKDAGIPLVGHNNPIGTDLSTAEPQVPGVTAQVMTPLTDIMRGLAQEVAAACEGKDPCKVAWLRTTRTLPQADALLDQALQAQMKQTPGIEIVAQGDGGLDVKGGIDAMQNFLQRERDIDVVLSYGAQSMEGAAQALQSAGKTLGKDVALISNGGTELQVSGVRDGSYFSSGLVVPRTEASLAVEQAVNAVSGRAVRRAINPLQEAGLPLNLDQRNKDRYPDFDGEWPR